MFRTKRSKERARARGRMLARQWVQEIASDVATRPLAISVEALPPRSKAHLQLLFRINPDGTRDLMNHSLRVEAPCTA